MVVRTNSVRLTKLKMTTPFKTIIELSYFREHIKTMSEAMKEGVPLIGHTTWESIDLVSDINEQYSKRYGFHFTSIITKIAPAIPRVLAKIHSSGTKKSLPPTMKI